MPRDHQMLPGVRWLTLGVISAGGVIGALARYALIVAFPQPDAAFAWPVLGINVTGCLLIGIVVAATSGLGQAGRLLRPFLATGLLGGFTTFSSYVTGMQRELMAGSPRTALAYGIVTVVAGLAAAWCGAHAGTAVWVARRLASRRPVPGAAAPAASLGQAAPADHAGENG